ncbi:hypothetical protein COL5a_004643 [Colletotrichum fioriniae]|nr:uncharacterized protein COL516b_011958 [Colletotrichum fioriniae]KAJ0296104.1 hypothetical protein COL516b_011958 [Colletotrichum fioriniae]KAJ0328855.1 hypothetical protein COL5a_004643 [Colletotrichum fioriniae]
MGVKREESCDIPLPSREFSRELSLPFRPSPAPSTRSSSAAFHSDLAPNKSARKITADPEILRVQPYLKFPGFIQPDVIISNEDRKFIGLLGLNRDLVIPNSPDLPIHPDHMQYSVALKVEEIFCAANGVLYVMGRSKEAKVSENRMSDLIETYARGRKEYLADKANPKFSRLADRQNCRLLKSVYQWIAFHELDESASSNLLWFDAKHRWVELHQIRTIPGRTWTAEQEAWMREDISAGRY